MTEPNKEDVEASTSATKEVAVEAGGGTGSHRGEGGHHGGEGGEDGALLERLSLRHTRSLSKRNILPLIPSVPSVRAPSHPSVTGEELHAAAKSVLRTNVDGVAGTMTAGNEEELLQIVQSFVLLQSHDGSAPPETIEAALASGFNGTKTDLDRYLELYGRNELPKPDVPSYLMLWLSAFNDIMMILLVIAMIILYAVGDIVAATAILVILLIATNIGAYTEYTSNIAAAQLGDLPGKSIVKLPNHPDASQQGFVEISNVELLPGMILNLRTGDLVPADAIILQALPNVDCSCMEALLTGESEPVSKRPYHHDVADADPHAHTKREGQTRLFMGTEFRGEALVLVVETGARTQMGQIFQSMADENIEQSPLQKMVDKLILVLALLSIAASILNAAICVPTGNGIEEGEEDPQWLVCTLNSVALTVAAVPENLPVALVIALAAIIRNLATRGVIVKSLPAGEELSRLNYVFSDKTGTLTQNIMTARAVVTLQGHVSLSPDFVGPEESTVLPVESALVHQVRILTAKAQNDSIRTGLIGSR
jgi:magnesium-transporting ATPase (P-type)